MITTVCAASPRSSAVRISMARSSSKKSTVLVSPHLHRRCKQSITHD
nr:MAG TPA: hypothetical protein [Siphoviridae sp. ctX8T1]